MAGTFGSVGAVGSVGEVGEVMEVAGRVDGQLEGQQIGRYLIRQRLGGGGVATVYQADDQVTGQSVALKLLPPHPDPATLNRFRREALMAGALRHPQIVRILQVGTAENSPAAYIAMDLVAGESLSALLARVGVLGAEESCLLLEPIARALAFAHSREVVHRDVKPSNILLRPLGMADEKPDAPRRVRLDALEFPITPMLSDFGIARFLDAPELTNVGRTVGTPAFMAPEQCMGSREVDGRADIYSLGTVLFRCVTGRLPFSGSMTQILHAHVFEPVVIDEEMARQLPPKVVEILRRALAKAPEDRYQDAHALAADLAAGGIGEGAAAGDTAVDATSTMTLAQMTATQVAVVPQAVTRAVQVLVPGTTSVENTAVAPSPSPKAPARRGPSWERVLWALFFLVLVGGGGLWSARSWLDARATEEGSQTTLPALVFVTFTPTPLEDVDDATGESAAGGGSAEVATATAAVMATATSMPTLMPTVTPSPTPSPTLQPAVTATPVPTSVPAIVPTVMPTVVPPTVVAGEAVVGTCAMVVDEFFLASVAQLTGELQMDFACPTSPARVVVGEWLPFERGMMVALENEPLVYVYYENGTWEQVPRANVDLPPSVPDRELPADRIVIPMPFARVLATQGRHVLLGEPLQSEPWRVRTVIQSFLGGVALGDARGGQVLFLARSQLRF